MFSVLIRPPKALPRASFATPILVLRADRLEPLQAVWEHGPDGRRILRWQRSFASLPPG